MPEQCDDCRGDGLWKIEDKLTVCHCPAGDIVRKSIREGVVAMKAGKITTWNKVKKELGL